jgi:hypothetical protein
MDVKLDLSSNGTTRTEGVEENIGTYESGNNRNLEKIAQGAELYSLLFRKYY